MKKKIYLISIVFFLIDLISKIIILSIENKLPIKVIENFFYIEKVTNSGAAFSILSGYTFIFILIAIIMLIYINKTMLKEVKTKLEILSFSMLIGGIIGNLFDRIIYGKVIDFLSFEIFNYNFPVFNLADTFICTSAFLLIILTFHGGKNEISSK